MKQRIHSYLLEQGIDIDENLVKDAAQVLAILLQQADISAINRQNIWQQCQIHLSSMLPENCEETLCRLFAAVDTVKTHILADSLSIFILKNQEIMRISHAGLPIVVKLPVNDDTANQHLAVRTALSAWFNRIPQTDEWIASGELSSKFYPECKQIWALPICTDTGGVLGVLYGEHAITQNINDEQFAWTLGLAIALQETLQLLIDLAT